MKKVELNLTADYINEDKEVNKTILEIIENNDSILLVAPQGTGKTSFVDKLKSKYNIAILSPTVSLARQTKRNLNISLANGTGYSTFNITRSDRFNSPLSGNVSTTFSSSTGLANMHILDEMDMIVIDEIHKVVQYSTFAYSQVSNILKIIDYATQLRIKILYLTATPNLIPCLKHFNLKKSIQVICTIKTHKNYISKCIILSNLTSNTKLINKIKQNDSLDGFQIALINNTNDIKQISKELNEVGIKTLSVNGKQFKNNHKTRDLISHFQKGIYNGYKVLLATSWIDCGLDFKGKNITNLYCIFDYSYNTGDFTVIRQFMARTRNSHPCLYINYPHLTDNEKIIFENYNVDQKRLFTDLEKIAKQNLEYYRNGLINQIAIKNIYGIYLSANREYKFKYEYSSLTLNYQIHKLFEKIKVHKNKYNIAELLGIPQELLNFQDQSITEYLNNIKDFILESIEENLAYTTTEINEKINQLSNGYFHPSRPLYFLSQNLPEFQTRVTNRNHQRKYRFIHTS